MMRRLYCGVVRCRCRCGVVWCGVVTHISISVMIVRRRASTSTIMEMCVLNTRRNKPNDRYVKACPQYKSPDQIGGATWPSGLVGQLKSPDADDKPSGFIASNKADRLHHPVWLYVGKRKRKADRLRSLRFFWPQFWSSTPTLSITIAGLRLCQTFLKILNSQKCWTKMQYREFEGPAIAMEGGGRSQKTKIVAKKIENKFSKLLMGEIGWRKSRRKNRTRRFNFSCCDFCRPTTHTLPRPSQSSQDHRWVTKIAPKKLKTVV